MTQQFHLRGRYPRQLKAVALFTRTKSRNKLSVHQLMNKPSVMYIYIYIYMHTHRILFSHKEMKLCYIPKRGWTLKTLC